MPLQVLISATIVEVDLSGKLQYGLQWYFSHQLSGDLGSAGYLGSALGGISSAGAAAGGFTYVIQNAAKSFTFALDALAANGKVKVLSSPSLMVLNNQEAKIQVGDQVPILTGQALVASGSPSLLGTQSIQYKDTGVILKTRPRVNAGGLVSMVLSQTVSNVNPNGSTTIGSPTISQREIVSNVVVKSGETIVLGGLISETINNNVTGIPLLSELPWLGPLFSSTSKSSNRSELVVLMTPRMVENATTSQQITNEYRRSLNTLYQQKPSPYPATTEPGAGSNLPQYPHSLN